MAPGGSQSSHRAPLILIMSIRGSNKSQESCIIFLIDSLAYCRLCVCVCSHAASEFCASGHLLRILLLLLSLCFAHEFACDDHRAHIHLSFQSVIKKREIIKRAAVTQRFFSKATILSKSTLNGKMSDKMRNRPA